MTHSLCCEKTLFQFDSERQLADAFRVLFRKNILLIYYGWRALGFCEKIEAI